MQVCMRRDTLKPNSFSPEPLQQGLQYLDVDLEATPRLNDRSLVFLAYLRSLPKHESRPTGTPTFPKAIPRDAKAALGPAFVTEYLH